MAIVKQDSGCRVGWVWYDNQEEASARAAVEREAAHRKVQDGHDFGYVYPGGVNETEVDGKPAWRVCTA
jgi:hypothetical protein